jgi:lysophospholipase L1-like esterase
MCLVYQLASGLARAIEFGQDSGNSISEIEQVYSIIQQESGIFSHEAAALPVIKRDRQGKIWAAWEKWEAGRSRIELASFGSTGIEASRIVSTPEGCDLSPDLAFSADGRPCVIWVNALEEKTRVLILDVSSGETWNLTAGSPASVTSPKILFDAAGSLWAFWNITSGQSGEIAFRLMERGQWTAPAFVPRKTKRPALNPDAAVDGRGTIWLTWSGYDGQDYQIYLTHWTGTSWAPETRVSEYPGPNLFPSLGFDSDGNPLVGWTRPSELGHVVCLSSYRNGLVGPETRLDSEPGLPSPPRFIQDIGGTVVGVKSRDRIQVRSLPQASASSYPSALSSPAPPRFLDNPQFDENKYVGLGDSITFGYVDWYPYPERGYIPRLNAILNATYGSQRVVNEGFGGEVTAEGLVRLDKVFIADLARYILIMEGTNDIISDISTDSAAFNLREMVLKCLSAGAFPTIATILPRYDWYGTYPYFRNRILSLNAKIRQIAMDLSVPIVDMYAAFVDYPPASGGVLSLLSIDLKHPSDKGYQFMAETWFSGIQNFPFAPVSLGIEKLGPERKARRRMRTAASASTSQADRLEPRQAPGNLLAWADNPKIKDPGNILGYRIYRKKNADSTESYEFLAFIQQALEYFDRGPAVLNQCAYVISTVRKDGVEGPISNPVH